MTRQAASSSAISLRGARVLITGGAGFIGSNLAHRCVELGASVTIYDTLDRNCGGNRHNLDGLESRIRLIERDIRDAAAIAHALEGQDIVFHCAAYTSHDGSMRDPLATLDVNCRGTLTLLEAMRVATSSPKLVHVGTSTQIGKMRYSPVDEQHPEFPTDVYSATKTASEKYALVYRTAHGLRVAVVRLGNVLGPRASIATPAFGFINYFVGLGLQGKSLTVYGEGRQLRSVTYVDDAVAALIAMGLHKDDNDGDAVYFATSDEQRSVAEIARAITDVVGGDLKFVDWPKDKAAIEVGDAIIRSDRFRAHTGWRPEFDMRTGLARTRDYFLPRLSQYL